MSQAPFQLVRFKHGKKTFEVMTTPGSVLKFRAGHSTSLVDVLAADIVWTNQHKGDRASEEDLREAFGSTDVQVALRAIIERGELQVSAAERKEALDRKTREVLTYLHRNYIDPKTNLPHPLVRLELALPQSKMHIDPEAPAPLQAAELVKKLHGILSFRKSEIEGRLKVPFRHVGAVGSVVHKLAMVTNETHEADGVSWLVGLAPGDFDAFTAALNKVTKGEFEFTMANGGSFGESSGAAGAAAASGGKGGKGGSHGKKK